MEQEGRDHDRDREMRGGGKDGRQEEKGEMVKRPGRGFTFAKL